MSTAETVTAGPAAGQPFPVPPAIRPERTLSAGQFPGNANVATPPVAAPSVDARNVKRNVFPVAPAVTLPGLTIAWP